jgi:tRNA modification GTPase
VYYCAPHTYTGDDLAELQCPGNPALLEMIVHRCIDLGARLAQPGEFTCRSFLAGKMDLLQAEGVAATIAAAGDSQLQAAKLLRQGKLGSIATELVDQLAGALALVEAGIDFTDQEDVVPITPGDLLRRINDIATKLNDLLAKSRSWGAIDALPRVVLAGAPSTGKSTLFNALLTRHRAVISEQPGTTRDIITEPLQLTDSNGREVEVMLIDIAGIDDPLTALDRDIQTNARTAIEQADLLLQITDNSQITDHATSSNSGSTPTLYIHTKSDLTVAPPDADLSICAQSGEGLDQLRQSIIQKLGDRPVSIAADMLALGPRHEAALRNACDRLCAAANLLAPQQNAHSIDHVELIASALRTALDELAALGGRICPDDLIGRIFANFCIGK